MVSVASDEKASNVELKFNFPKEELEFLTLCAEKKGVSLNQMTVYFIIKGIHKENTTWEEMCEELGEESF